MVHSDDSGGVPPPHPLLNLLGRVVAMTHTGEDQELDYWNLVFWTFLCLSSDHASYAETPETDLQCGTQYPQFGIIVSFSRGERAAGAPINSKHMANTAANTLQSIGGDLEPPTATESSKTGFWVFWPSFALSEAMERRTSNVSLPRLKMSYIFDFRQQEV